MEWTFDRLVFRYNFISIGIQKYIILQYTYKHFAVTSRATSAQTIYIGFPCSQVVRLGQDLYKYLYRPCAHPRTSMCMYMDVTSRCMYMDVHELYISTYIDLGYTHAYERLVNLIPLDKSIAIHIFVRLTISLFVRFNPYLFPSHFYKQLQSSCHSRTIAKK